LPGFAMVILVEAGPGMIMPLASAKVLNIITYSVLAKVAI